MEKFAFFNFIRHSVDLRRQTPADPAPVEPWTPLPPPPPQANRAALASPLPPLRPPPNASQPLSCLHWQSTIKTGLNLAASLPHQPIKPLRARRGGSRDSLRRRRGSRKGPRSRSWFRRGGWWSVAWRRRRATGGRKKLRRICQTRWFKQNNLNFWWLEHKWAFLQGKLQGF